MKDKLIYVLIIVITFFMVTGAMFYGASTYKNIFALDFSPVETDTLKPKPVQPDAVQTAQTEPVAKPIKIDSVITPVANSKVYQDPAAIQINASEITDSTKILLEQIKKLKTQLTTSNPVVSSHQTPTINANSLKDSVYNKWVKSSVKLYEAMDSKKAAKIIQGYNDNIARDIIYSMKKKKAAEIMAEFKPDKANKIINLE
ncbi:MAG: hypothetical protein RDU14_09835 [Melioribacteraceae bacterium]|nr:hypothetical protein [Melioribacteraceae bacterium]